MSKCKFAETLCKDAKGIKEQRALILSEEVKIQQENLVRRLAGEKRNLEVKLLNLTDLSPDNSYSLRPGGKEFNAAAWVAEMQNVKVAILNKSIELETAEKTMNEWFAEPKE